MGKRETSIFEDLIEAPWWVSVLLAFLVYYLFFQRIPQIQSDSIVFKGLAQASQGIGTMILLLLAGATLLSLIRSWAIKWKGRSKEKKDGLQDESVFGETEGSPFFYRQKFSLFTPAERNFLNALEVAVGNRFRIFGKTRVADLLEPRERKDKKEWHSAFNKIKAKHIDFVLCDPKTFAPVVAIELNDSSHSRPDREERDKFLTFAFESAGLSLLFTPTQSKYNPGLLAVTIEACLGNELKKNEPAIPIEDGVDISLEFDVLEDEKGITTERKVVAKVFDMKTGKEEVVDLD